MSENGTEPKITNKDILAAVAALQRISNLEIKKGRTNYAVAYNIRQIETRLKDYDNARIALLKQFGTLNKKGTEYDVPKEKKEEWQKEQDALIDLEISLDFRTIKAEDLDGVAGVTPGLLVPVFWMLEDDNASNAATQTDNRGT